MFLNDIIFRNNWLIGVKGSAIEASLEDLNGNLFDVLPELAKWAEEEYPGCLCLKLQIIKKKV